MLNYAKVESVQEVFTREFYRVLINEKKKNNYKQIALLCIGTDKMTGDCFGPLVGTKLMQLLEDYNIYNVNIYGSLEKNINYTNILEVLKKVKDENKNSCIVVIDAALSSKENIGKIIITNKNVSLGEGLKKDKVEIGNIGVKAVVGKDCKMPKYNFKILQNISLNVVMTLADVVANGIFESIKNM